MTILSKTLLTLALAGLTLGSIVAHYGDNAGPVALTLLLPLGAIAFGLFLIVFAVQKEVAAYDREQATKGAAAHWHTASAPKTSETGAQLSAVQLKE